MHSTVIQLAVCNVTSMCVLFGARNDLATYKQLPLAHQECACHS